MSKVLLFLFLFSYLPLGGREGGTARQGTLISEPEKPSIGFHTHHTVWADDKVKARKELFPIIIIIYVCRL